MPGSGPLQQLLHDLFDFLVEIGQKLAHAERSSWISR
jgi:hypothetical protein